MKFRLSLGTYIRVIDQKLQIIRKLKRKSETETHCFVGNFPINPNPKHGPLGTSVIWIFQEKKHTAPC